MPDDNIGTARDLFNHSNYNYQKKLLNLVLS
jgi:hypothetical protein